MASWPPPALVFAGVALLALVAAAGAAAQGSQAAEPPDEASDATVLEPPPAHEGGERLPVAGGQSDDERRAYAMVAELLARRPLNTGRVAFEGDVVAHLPWGVSRFTVHVEKDGPQAVITSHDVPWFLPRRLILTLAPAADMLSDFDLRFNGKESDARGVYLVLSGKHRAPSATGARHGRVWLDPALGEVARIELAYVWGTVRSELQYAQVSARTVVVQQTVTVEPLGVRLTVRYRDFRWPSPSP